MIIQLQRLEEIILLKPGKYLNLYPGAPIEPEKGDVSDWVNSYKQIFGEGLRLY